MPLSTITIKGARVHNLKNVSLELPKNALICFTGVSGSGKSSLAFDTLYAEGQRRYVESLSAYARQFLDQMQKPDVDHISGLSPAISIEQKASGFNPRSTVGTITEIYDFLRVLYARIGTPHCVQCGDEIGAQTREQIIGSILALPAETRLHVLAPVIQGRRGEYRDLFEDLLKQGYLRARVNGEIVSLSDAPGLDRNMRHTIEVVADRLVLREGIRPRLLEAIDGALHLSGGTVMVSVQEGDSEQAGRDLLFSTRYACVRCGISYEEPTPQLFSFNSPQGMCPTCHGLGTMLKFDPRRVIPDPALSIEEGAIKPLGQITNLWKRHFLEGVAEHLGFTLDTPWAQLTKKQQDGVLYGLGTRRIVFTFRNGRGGAWTHKDPYPGVIPDLARRYSTLKSERHKAELEPYMAIGPCEDCRGDRLKPEALAVTLGGRSIADLCRLSVEETHRFFQQLSLTRSQALIAEEALKEIRARIDFLMNVGLDYLTLDRTAPTLSGGEAQRIRLASQIGRGLVGVMYVLDEPSIGLHPRDNRRLLDTLCMLRDQGNTVIVVEHDEETMWAADHLVDFGPGAGVKGGQIVATGTPEEVAGHPASLTGRYLRGEKSIPIPRRRRPVGDRWVEIVGAAQNNLKQITVKIPVGVFTCVTGVSGSGKSSLINDILYAALARDLNGANTAPGAYGRILGAEHLDKVIDIDQSPIGRTPRSNPATYTKVFDHIRALFAETPEARVRGYKPGRFSFNVPGGRCEACEGNGATRVDMDFLADVWVTCPVCEGRRFDRETLEIRYKGHSVADVLDMDVQEALELFRPLPAIARTLGTLHEVGLDYIKLGQPAPTLSGGEAQRVKLARELCKRSTGRTLYVLDEPTTGLHFEDIQHLLNVLHAFVDAGNTVVVIEHNTDVIKTADWIIDLGPEGGEGGGRLIAAGTPEDLAGVASSYTGQVLGRVLAGERAKRPARRKTSAPPEAGNGAITEITVQGAREHNLRDLSLAIPRDRMTVLTGVSGSGKTSLALDTIYAEGQRRYVESLSAYARQFLQQMQKPRVDHITGLSPAISIEQKSAGRNPRSTVGTITEIYEYLRALYALVGVPHCPRCRVPVGAQTSSEIVDRLLALPDGARVTLLAPVEPEGAEDYEAVLERARRNGYVRVRIDGEVRRLDEEILIDKRRRHEVCVVVDRIAVKEGMRQRLADSVETALGLSRGLAVAEVEADGAAQRRDIRFSQHYSCSSCGTSYDEVTPQSFSFNHQAGMCEACEGLGTQPGIDLSVLIPDRKKSIRGGGLPIWWEGRIEAHPMMDMLERVGQAFGFTLDTPFEEMTQEQLNVLLYGSDRWIEAGGKEQGSRGAGERRSKGARKKEHASLIPHPSSLNRSLSFSFQFRGIFPTVEMVARYAYQFPELGRFLQPVACSACQGGRLRPESLAVTIDGLSIADLCARSVESALAFVNGIRLTPEQREVVGEVLQEIRSRLQFLVDVGLEYLALDRRAPTLSGGEAQRIRLASQIGSGLTGVLYVLDEPTIGLHPRDNRRLIQALLSLRDLGNTLIMVEHDRETLEQADYLVDLGPGAGIHGGRLVASGAPGTVRAHPASLTGGYLSHRLRIEMPAARRKPGKTWLRIRGARQNNLKSIDAAIPLGLFVCVTGVSGSGKSSLINDTLYPALASTFHRAQLTPGPHDGIEGLEHLDKVINIDQTPIGYSPRSDPATYVGIFDQIRALYAQVPEARVRGYTAKRFSFNVPGGRCEACQGLGVRKIEMHFLADVWVTCEECDGARYMKETLDIAYKGRTIADTLRMTVAEALAHFETVPRLRRMLQTLYDVGLDYIQLGQSAITLSGGEAQRVKLARELSRPGTGKTIYLLDEPTTGLHFDDIRKLLAVLNRLVGKGNTVLVIEHNLDVIKTADWIVDLGPEGGDRGGEVVACGPPEAIAAAATHTGRILEEEMEKEPRELATSGPALP
jgi:excinuclease ABC subunit A